MRLDSIAEKTTPAGAIHWSETLFERPSAKIVCTPALLVSLSSLKRLSVFASVLENSGFRPQKIHSKPGLQHALHASQFRAAVLVGSNGIELAELAETIYSADNNIDQLIICLPKTQNLEAIAQAITQGIVHDVELLESEQNLSGVRRGLERLKQLDIFKSQHSSNKKNVNSCSSFQGMIGESPEMQHVFQSIKRMKSSRLPILIHGETGTGKTSLAKAIHHITKTKKKPFISLTCLDDSLEALETEFFGNEKGALAGTPTTGALEAAHGGTLFLNNIENLPPQIQDKLARFLEEKSFLRNGSGKPIEAQVHIVAATRADLKTLAFSGHFREDLYYRLSVLELNLPPLRQRAQDAELLAQHFLAEILQEKGQRKLRFSRAALSAIAGHDWPGNIRELSGAVRRAAIMAQNGIIQPSDLGLGLARSEAPLPTRLEAISQLEQSLLRDALQRAGNNVTVASELLDISRVAFYKLMRKYGMAVPRVSPP